LKGGFFDFVVYRIPEGKSSDEHTGSGRSISDKKVLLFVSDPYSQEIRGKLLQIVGAVGLSEDDFDILNLDLILEDWKSILEDHHEKALVFANEKNRPKDAILYQVYHLENGEMAFADDVSRLIQDEKEGIIERRKALWVMLKSWMS
jgi:hypothetical protein